MNHWHVVHDKNRYLILRSDKDLKFWCNDLAAAYDLADHLNASASYGSPSYQRQSSIPDWYAATRPASLMVRSNPPPAADGCDQYPSP